MKIVTENIISSSHHLPYYLGKCKENHGHNWRIRVMVEGTLQTEGPQQGMIVDFSHIKAIVMKLDHRNLNEVITNPTAENIALYLCNKVYKMNRMAPAGSGIIEKVLVQVFETSKSCAECSSDDLEEYKDKFVEEKANEISKNREADKDVGNGSSS